MSEANISNNNTDEENGVASVADTAGAISVPCAVAAAGTVGAACAAYTISAANAPASTNTSAIAGITSTAGKCGASRVSVSNSQDANDAGVSNADANIYYF